MNVKHEPKTLGFVGSTREDLRTFPRSVQKAIGDSLLVAQFGGKASNAMPLKGFGGAGVLEIIERFDGDTYRAIYTVRLRHAVYVLHCFQKKSTHGRAMSKRDSDLIQRRLREAEAQDRAKGTSS